MELEYFHKLNFHFTYETGTYSHMKYSINSHVKWTGLKFEM